MEHKSLIIDYFAEFLGVLDPKNSLFFESLERMRLHGQHPLAISKIKENIDLNHFERNILLYRFYLEIKNFQLAHQYLIQAKKRNLHLDLITKEESYLNFENQHFGRCLKEHQKTS
ncbi:hypothetical protein MJH12_04005, partial [bacterium]|nr:hypothetical protein [bacterium]